MSNPWFRLYSRIITDPIIEFLSFEDQRHYVWLLCLKNDGILDQEYPKPDMLDRVVARKLGLQGEAFDNAKIRLTESGLIDDQWQPKKWDDLQYKSDSSKERTKAYRERLAKKQQHKQERQAGDVTVTAQDTEQNRTDTEEKKPHYPVGLNIEAWEQYTEFRRQSKIKKLTARGEQLKHKWLIEQGDYAVQQKIVDYSISNGYTGLFELKEKSNGTHQQDNSAPARVQRAIDKANEGKDGILDLN